MRIKLAVAGGIVAMLAVVIWRCGPSSTSHRSTVATTAARASTRTAKRPDPRRLARGSITGVVTVDSKPVANARVCTIGANAELAATLFRDPACAVTDARGAYTLGERLPATYSVHASAQSYRPSGVSLTAGEAPPARCRRCRARRHRARRDRRRDREGPRLHLEPLVTITGRIVEHPSGKPVQGIAMFASRSHGSSTFTNVDRATSVTDKAGRFTIEGAPSGTISITGNPEHHRLSVTRRVVGDSDLGVLRVVSRTMDSKYVGLTLAPIPEAVPPTLRSVVVQAIDPEGPRPPSI